MATEEDKFIAAVKRAESAASHISAFVVINPRFRDVQLVCPSGPVVGRVVITHARSGMLTRAVAWLPGSASYRHAGSASGGGYDKSSAAMSGARFVSATGETMHVIPDDGMGWRWHLEQAGYVVAQAC
jgi:hypothetical protein